MLAACKSSLGILGTVKAASCFVSGITGLAFGSCLQKTINPCCQSSLPDDCTSLGQSTDLLSATVSTGSALACQAALGVFNGISTVGNCFTSLTTNANLLSCLGSGGSVCNSCTLPDSCQNLISFSGTTGVQQCLLDLASGGTYYTNSTASCFQGSSVSAKSCGTCLRVSLPTSCYN